MLHSAQFNRLDSISSSTPSTALPLSTPVGPPCDESCDSSMIMTSSELLELGSAFTFRFKA